MADRNLNTLYKKRLTDPRVKEGIRSTIYDHQSYVVGGQGALRFFQQGLSGGRTLADTNLQLNAQLPAGWKFIAESIEVAFYPGSSAGAFVPQTTVKSAHGVAAAAPVMPNYANDVITFYHSMATLNLTIGSKSYLDEAPLVKFPPKTGMMLIAADAVATTVAASQPSMTADYMRATGRPYMLDPSIPIPPTVGFSIALLWPNGALALPSGFIARVGVSLDGILFRD